MLNYILPVLIFLSLGIIIFIVGKHLPEFKKSKKDNDFDKKNKAVKEKFIAFVLSIAKKTKEFFLFLAEKTVKKSKKTLHLVHFWLIKIKNKKNKKDDFYNEIEAKEQLIKEEEDDLDHVINEDLATADEQDLIKQEQKKKKTGDYNLEEIKKGSSNQKRKDPVDYYLKKEEKQESSEESESYKNEQPSQAVNEDFKKELLKEVSEFQGEENREKEEKTQRKVSQFFSQGNKEEDSLGQENEAVAKGEEVLAEDLEKIEKKERAKKTEEQETKEEKEGRFKTFLEKANIFSRFKKNKEKKASEEEGESEEKVQTEFAESNDKFSDGIVKIEDYQKPKKEENLLIKEVVKVDRSAAEIDDEIGVDREILEKKLVQKIVDNPKQIENYRQLGELYIKIENYPEALECYKQILKIYPRDVDSKRKMEKVAFLKRVKKREKNK